MKKRPRASTVAASANRQRSRETESLQTESLQTEYKVVELSSVDEQTIEKTLNAWCPEGWALDGIQFAMRESSKRPSMAFVLFTRKRHLVHPQRRADGAQSRDHRGRPLDSAANASALGMNGFPGGNGSPGRARVSAYERLRQLAGDDDPTEGELIALPEADE